MTRRLVEREGWAVVWNAPSNMPLAIGLQPVVPCSGSFHVYETELLAHSAHAQLDWSTQKTSRVAKVRVLVEVAY